MLSPDRARHPLDELGVEGRRPRERRREDRRAERGEPGQALLVRDRGDAEPRARDELCLQRGELARAVDRIDGRGAERTREMPQPVSAALLEGRRVRERLLHRRHVARAELRPDPDAAELAELLVERHLAQQRLHALGERPRGVRPSVRLHRPVKPRHPAPVKSRSAMRDRTRRSTHSISLRIWCTIVSSPATGDRISPCSRSMISAVQSCVWRSRKRSMATRR